MALTPKRQSGEEGLRYALLRAITRSSDPRVVDLVHRTADFSRSFINNVRYVKPPSDTEELILWADAEGADVVLEKLFEGLIFPEEE